MHRGKRPRRLIHRGTAGSAVAPVDADRVRVECVCIGKGPAERDGIVLADGIIVQQEVRDLRVDVGIDCERAYRIVGPCAFGVLHSKYNRVLTGREIARGYLNVFLCCKDTIEVGRPLIRDDRSVRVVCGSVELDDIVRLLPGIWSNRVDRGRGVVVARSR